MSLLRNKSWLLILSVVLYFVGAAFIPNESVERLKSLGYAEQNDYTWIDHGGEEHEDRSTLKIEGVGKVLTYRELYSFSCVLIIPILLIGRWLFGKSQDELRTIIFGNSLIGIGLIVVSTKAHLMSTIMFWLGIIAASLYLINHERQ